MGRSFSRCSAGKYPWIFIYIFAFDTIQTRHTVQVIVMQTIFKAYAPINTISAANDISNDISDIQK